MTEHTVRPTSNKLRRMAEERLSEQRPPGIEEGPLRLHHELQVHQVELEMQNEELRQTRDDLEAALEKYTNLYDFAPVGYVTLDRSGTVLSANFTAADLVGIERSRLVGRNFALFITDEARTTFNTFLRKAVTSSTKEVCEVALPKVGKAPLNVQIEGVATSSGQEYRIALIDITDRKQAEEAFRLEKEAETAILLAQEAAESLRREKEAAEENTRLKSQFLVNMSHELRTPMTGILGMLELSLEENLSPVLLEYLKTTQSSAKSLLRILNDILDMAKFEAGKFIIEEKTFSPHECITQVVNIITPEVRRKGLDITVTVAENLPDMVLGDQLRLRQVLINLIGNAVKFTNAGTVTIQITTGNLASDGTQEFVFSITDTGIGISDDKKELLFRAFSQVDASLSRPYGGTGLGLAISREIVKLMGGTISFTSEKGVGSRFSFTIPLKKAEFEHDALLTAEPPLTEAIATIQVGDRIPRLLLVEDEPVIRLVLGRMFQRAKFHLDFAEDGRQAVEILENQEYDLVIMDIQMPQLDGLEATRIIREKERKNGSHTPIIAMTAHARKEDEESCFAAGMDAFISKPIDFKKTLQVIANIIKLKSGSVRNS